MRLLCAVLFFCVVSCASPVQANSLSVNPSDLATEDSFNWAKEWAEKGTASAQWSFAEMLDGKSPSFLVDPSLATVWYRRAAEAGDERAQFALGERYEKGYTVVQNDQMALEWYLRAANNNILVRSEAERKVAEFYRYGRGVKADKVEAYFWYLRRKFGRQHRLQKDEVQSLRAQLTPREIAGVERRLFWSDVRYAMARNVKRFCRFILSPVSGTSVGFFMWLLFVGLHLMQPLTSWGGIFPRTSMYALAFGIIIGFFMVLLSAKTAFLFGFGIFLIYVSAISISALFGGACLLFCGAFWARPPVKQWLQSAGGLMGLLALGIASALAVAKLFFLWSIRG